MCTALKDTVLTLGPRPADEPPVDWVEGVAITDNEMLEPRKKEERQHCWRDVDAGQRSPVTIQMEIVGCQGLTVQKLSLDLRRPVFSHGQLYSAITRVPDADNVLILKYEDDSSQRITNIVWEELLLQLQLPREGDKWSL
ncbi:hypothetical protein B0H13DRAFT_1917591 [Mycena leptocephala]|nr:hypothetical protein B0H13DRAFT_1917591 [Mycena leptocephala]